MKKSLLIALTLPLVLLTLLVLKPAPSHLESILNKSSASDAVTPETLSSRATHVQTSMANGVALALNHTNEQGERLNDWRRAIDTSKRWEHQLAATLIEKNTEIGFLRLKSLLQLDPHNPLLNFSLAQLCLRQEDPRVCNQALLDAIDVFDSSNGSLQDLKALLAAKLGEDSRALTALQEGARSQYSHNYAVEYLDALGESLNIFGLHERNMGWITALLGYEAARVDAQAALLHQLCLEKIQNELWRETCLARGLNQLQTGRNFLLSAQGLRLAEAMSQTTDPRLDAAREQLRSKYVNLTHPTRIQLWEAAEQLNWSLTDSQWQTFLNIYAGEGELAAFRFLDGLLVAAGAKG